MKTKGEALSHSRAFKVDTKEDQGAEDKQLGWIHDMDLGGAKI